MLEIQNVSNTPAAALTLYPQAQALAPQVIVCSPSSALRPRLERFIQDGFRRSHGAAVHSFMPVLLGLLDDDGRILGAAGYRPATHERLYLEHYLDQPIENLIAGLHPTEQVQRSGIAEIGNFACADSTIGLTLMTMLADFLLDQEKPWAVFTATRAVRRMTRQLGIGLTEIGRANPSRVAGGTDDWGAYYSTDPRVMLGFVPSWHRITTQARSL